MTDRPEMPTATDLGATIRAAWWTSHQTTVHLIEHLPSALWRLPIPGMPGRSIGTICAHLHNCRCTWTRTLGDEHGIPAPALVDRLTVSRRRLCTVLKHSGRGIDALLELGLSHGGRIPPSRRYVWRNLPLDVGHVLAYFVAHEGHHRGQVVMLARQMGHRLPGEVTNGLWQWSTRVSEIRRAQSPGRSRVKHP